MAFRHLGQILRTFAAVLLAVATYSAFVYAEPPGNPADPSAAGETKPTRQPIYDENANGVLDKNSLGVPTEGYGFSNDAVGSGGPPKFGQAAFDYDGSNKSLTITLNY